MTEPFDLTGRLPRGRTVIEASAGTGKTYTIAALIARFIAGDTVGSGHDLSEGASIDEILVVTFTRAAASELRDRVRSKLRVALDVVDGAPVPPGELWTTALHLGSRRVRRRRAARLHDALTRFDEATITTIHGFCQQALGQAGLRGAADPAATLVDSHDELIAEVCRDLLVRELAAEPYLLSTDAKDRPVEFESGRVRHRAGDRQPNLPVKVERDMVATVRAVLTNAGALTLPSPSIGAIAGRWTSLVAEAVGEIEARQRARRQTSYDRLVRDLRDALFDPGTGPALAEQLASRFPVVLVDEFQDTDRLQWQVLERAFGSGSLIVVGDPKQAIYRFRGADVHAYIDAVAGALRTTLGVNHRSDRRLLDALGVLWHGATLGNEHIPYRRVDAAPTAPRCALDETGTRERRASVHLRVVADSPAIAHTTRGLESGAVQRVILGDVASRIRTLLDEGRLTDGAPRPVRPSDIAVLVPSQRRAGDTAAVLREWGIPSVRARTGSVVLSEAAVQWRLLLAGLVTPTRAGAARAAGLSWFFDLDPAHLSDAEHGDPADESALAQLQRQLATLADRVRHDGVGAFYEQLRSESKVLEVTLGGPDGDRNLTDLDHIADLLVAATSRGTTEPLQVQQALDRLLADATQRSDAPESMMRRIESDEQAVQITTVHAAKGLEYPIVLLPFASIERPNAARPYVYNAGGERIVDVASWVAWADGFDEGSSPGLEAIKERKAAATTEVDADALRALYVAMTRAKHRLEVWWAPTPRCGTSSLGRLLLDRDGAGPLHNSSVGSAFERLDSDQARAQVEALAAASNGTIAVFDVAVDRPIRRPLAMESRERRPLTVADGSGRFPLSDHTWRTWSFTAIAEAAARRSTTPIHHAVAAGGSDEDPEAYDARVPIVTARPLLPDDVGGTTFGTMVHAVLEQVDPSSPSLSADLRAALTAQARAAGLPVDVDAIAAGLDAAARTPLGTLFGGRSLRQLGRPHRLAELTFDMPLADKVPARAVGEVLAGTLSCDDPLRAYASHLAEALGTVTVGGWLTGSIDGVFHVDDHFVVVDYKTNRLRDGYGADALLAAMAHGHYPLQAVLYSVALHRYLRWRLGPRYEPVEHLGGTAYLFLRGMTGPPLGGPSDESPGVFSWRPPVAAIEAVDKVLGGGDG